MKITTDQIKTLVTVYPFLKPVNVWTGKTSEYYEYDYFVGQHNLPEGWTRLFLIFCKSLRPHLIDANYLDKFIFTDVKEKYGTMRLYNNGCPADADHLEIIYEQFSYYVCQKCGQFATKETEGWVSTYCDDCLENCGFYANTTRVHKPTSAKVIRYKNNESCNIQYSFKELKKEYKYVKDMSDEEFFDYITTV